MNNAIDNRKELAKALLDACINAKYLYLTEFGKYLKAPKEKTENIPMERLLKMVESASREAHEAAYYDRLEGFHVDEEDEEVFDELVTTGLLNFDNIWIDGEEKQPGTSAWVRIKTETGFKVVHAKFMRISRRNLIQKQHNLQQKMHQVTNQLMKSMDLNSFEPLKEKYAALRKERLEALIMNYSGLSPVVAKYQKSKSVFETIPATDCQVLEDQDVYERFEEARKSSDIKIKTVYDKNTASQVHYMRQRGISKQRAEVLANLEGTSIHYDLAAMFQKLEKA